MKQEKSSKIELAAYALIAVAALGLVAYMVRPAPKNKTPVDSNQTIEPGFRLGVASEWGAHERTLVIVLQRGCIFCTASAPFYRRLADLFHNAKDLHVMAVLPQKPEDGVAYLAKLGLQVGDVRQGSLSALRIPGTPTLLLVDRQGIVQNVWVGKLSGNEETQVLNTLGLLPKS
jgi:hypothetical protein